ncbi:MAG: cohesin domain-containing protein [Candidatus Bathyarchaeia archaeon]|jgi:hypothetical protein
MRFNQKKTSIVVLLFVASLLVVLPVQMVKAQTSTTTVTVTPQTSTPVVGQTLTINIQLNNVQNLYAVDVTLNWSTSSLSLQTNQSFVGTSNGVLNNPTSVVIDTASQQTGEYHLVATSVNPASAYSGTGTIATLTFKVTSAGDSNLTLASTLADYAPGGISEPIAHNDLSGTVDATVSSTSSSSPTPTSASPTPSIPEFPMVATFSVVVVLSSAIIVLSVKKIIKTTSVSGIKPQR